METFYIQPATGRGITQKQSKVKIRFTVEDMVLQTKILLNKRTFIESPHIEELYQIICEYFNKDPNFIKRGIKRKDGFDNYSFDKGLLLMGGTGIGKTFIFEELLPSAFKKVPQIAYKQTNPDIIKGLFEQHESSALNIMDAKFRNLNVTHPAPSYHLYIDDIGNEEKDQQVQVFGRKYPYMKKLFEHRWKISNRFNFLTHGSTNLSMPEIKALYADSHDRVWSRIQGLFNFIPVISKIDFRTTRTYKNEAI